MNKPIALIVPWYGDNIKGGAEWECNFLAHSLQEAGHPVEVFTTCVKQASDDRGTNTIEPGIYTESGITVRRFLVRENRDVEAYSISNLRIYNNNFNREDEEIYFREDINSPDMYRFIDEHQDDYRVFIFIPYMYGIALNGASHCKGKSILIPCLHDESYAYMEKLKEHMKIFNGMAFLSQPEKELAEKLYDLSNVKTQVLGAGVETDWVKYCDGKRFRQKYDISDNFILYAGRKDKGKKADELIQFFINYKKERPGQAIKLVLIGGGEIPCEIPKEYSSEIIDLGFVSAEDKYDGFAACAFLCNPSYFESFSIVIMESWLAKKPVLVSEHCSVTKNFAKITKAGLWYSNYYEFREAVDFLIKEEWVCEQMGDNGFHYVMRNYSKKTIAENYVKFVDLCGL